MDFFISDALATAAQTPQPSPFMSLLPLVLIFAVFWFLIIRPQTKRAKQHREMVAALKAGDEIVTQGGLLGRVIAVDDAFLTVEIANQVQVRVQRHMVGTIMPKGTVASLD
ncbi:MAG: preprotein translocase subunit YajC [Gammaproteobacteria bacterium]